MLNFLLFALTVQAEPCRDLTPFLGVQPGHHLEGALHLVPSYQASGGWQGYLIVALDAKRSARGFKAGDLLLELDGLKPEPPGPGHEPTAWFAKLKSFKTAKVERCDRLSIQ